MREATQAQLPGVEGEGPELEAATAAPWPKKLAEQTREVLTLLGRHREALTAKQVSRGFKGAKGKEVEAVLETLAALGHVVVYEEGEGARWAKVGG